MMERKYSQTEVEEIARIARSEGAEEERAKICEALMSLASRYEQMDATLVSVCTLEAASKWLEGGRHE